jgi:hypothetical protein
MMQEGLGINGPQDEEWYDFKSLLSKSMIEQKESWDSLAWAS